MSAKSTPPRRKKKVTAPKVEPEPQDESSEEELSPELLALMEQRSFANPTNTGLATIVRPRHWFCHRTRAVHLLDVGFAVPAAASILASVVPFRERASRCRAGLTRRRLSRANSAS